VKKNTFLLCLVLLTSPPWAEAAEGSFSWLSEVRYRLGDDPSWASPAFDDSAWESANFWDLPGSDSLIWIRGELRVGAHQRRPGEPLGLGGGMLATCEIHWDGELLPAQGKGGATPEAEVPGPIEFLLHIPDRLAEPGLHSLALRCSTHHRHFEPTSGFWLVGAGPYGDLALIGRGYSWRALVSLSGMLIFAIFSLVFFALEPTDRSHLLLGLFCLAGAGLLVAESWRSLFPYTYNWHLLRLSMVTALAWTLGLLLIALLLTRFRLPKRVKILALSGFLAALPVLLLKSWDAKVLALLGIIGVVGLVLAGQAMGRRERGSGLVATGLHILNLYGEDGFRILREAAASAFHTIIVSAHHGRALEAFEYGVLDFVPKPFDEARLRKALERYEKREEGLRQRLRVLAVRCAGEVRLVAVDEVTYIRGSGDYSELHTKDGKAYLHDKTLTALALLLPTCFERVHRSVIVDTRQVESLLNEPGSRYFLRLVDGTRLPVSREKVQGLRARWG